LAPAAGTLGDRAARPRLAPGGAPGGAHRSAGRQPGGGLACEAFLRSPAHGGTGGRGLSDCAPRAELRGGAPGRRPAPPPIPGPRSRGRPRARPGDRRRGSSLGPAAYGIDNVELAPSARHFESAGAVRDVSWQGARPTGCIPALPTTFGQLGVYLLKE